MYGFSAMHGFHVVRGVRPNVSALFVRSNYKISLEKDVFTDLDLAFSIYEFELTSSAQCQFRMARFIPQTEFKWLCI